MFEVQNPGCEGQNPGYEGPMSLWVKYLDSLSFYTVWKSLYSLFLFPSQPDMSLPQLQTSRSLYVCVHYYVSSM